MKNSPDITLDSLFQQVMDSESVLTEWLNTATKKYHLGKMNADNFHSFCNGIATISLANRSMMKLIATLENEAGLPPREAFNLIQASGQTWRERYEKSENRKIFLQTYPEAQIEIYGKIVTE